MILTEGVSMKLICSGSDGVNNYVFVEAKVHT